MTSRLNSIKFIFLTFVIFCIQYILKDVNALKSENISCDWYRTETFPRVFKRHVEPRLLLSTKSHIEPVEINPTVLINTHILKERDFGKEKKSILIIHGWRSSSTVKWVTSMTKKLHDNMDVNIFLVDWSITAYNFDYNEVTQDLPAVANAVHHLIRSLRFKTWNHITETCILWNNLYFIGHDLGAHLSGQVAYLLKQNSFWKIERITGLDPSKPCFAHNFDHFKLDASDADFVDVIHSNIDTIDNLLPLGHMDFFVDDKSIRPKCKKSAVICSRQLSYELYIHTLSTSTSNNCTMYGHLWDGTHESAEKMFNDFENNKICIDCPQMGINAINSDKRGKFLVLISGLNDECVTSDNPINTKKTIKVVRL